MLTQEIKVNEERKKKEPRGGNEENYYGKSIASGDNLSGSEGIVRMKRRYFNFLERCLSGSSDMFPHFLAQVTLGVWRQPGFGGMPSLT